MEAIDQGYHSPKMMEMTTSNLSDLNLCDGNSTPNGNNCDNSRSRIPRPALSSRIPRPVTAGSRGNFGFEPCSPPLPPRSSSPSGSIELRDGSDTSSFSTENGRSTPRSPGGTVKKQITSKVNSFANIKHTPVGGKVQVFSEKVDFSDVSSKCQSKSNMKHKPGGGNIQVFDDKLTFKETAQSKVGSFKNSKHVAGGGDIKIESHRLNWEASSRVGTWKNANHKPGGGDVQIDNHELRWDVTSKVGSWKNMKHKPGGGNIQIENQNLSWDTKSKVGSWKNFQHKPGGGNVQIVDEQLDWKVEARTKHRLEQKKKGAMQYQYQYQSSQEQKLAGDDYDEHLNGSEDHVETQAPLETDLDAEVAAVMQ